MLALQAGPKCAIRKAAANDECCSQGQAAIRKAAQATGMLPIREAERGDEHCSKRRTSLCYVYNLKYYIRNYCSKPNQSDTRPAGRAAIRKAAQATGMLPPVPNCYSLFAKPREATNVAARGELRFATFII